MKKFFAIFFLLLIVAGVPIGGAVLVSSLVLATPESQESFVHGVTEFTQQANQISADIIEQLQNPADEEEEQGYIITPLWELAERYRETLPANLTANGSLVANITEFWQNQAQFVTFEYVPFSETTGFTIDTLLERAAQQAVRQGFENDNIRLPFNESYITNILNNLYFHFAVTSAENPTVYEGLYIGGAGTEHSYIFVNVVPFEDTLLQQFIIGAFDPLVAEVAPELLQLTAEQAAEMQADLIPFLLAIVPQEELAIIQEWLEFWFVFTTIHEIGHAFGLGESLADLFTETIMGLDSTIRGVWGERLAALGVFSGDGGFVYNSTLDRELFRRLQLQGRASEFWDAAFHSNFAYSQLWDSVFAEYVTASDLEIARGLYFAAMNQNQPSALANNFAQFSGGITLAFAGELLIDDWNTITLGQDIDGRALSRFQWLMQTLTEFAAEQQTEIQPHVLDTVIVSHLVRFGGFYLP
ncbi:MAG: hypothetical protein FWG68_04330 [Defluviitaleaceae bacterium]|nr:hypothetical protein [Defluviitaleaceae bacterium]